MSTNTRATIKPLQVKVSEAALLLGYGRVTIWRMVQKGELQATGKGKSRRIVYASLEQWIKRSINQ